MNLQEWADKVYGTRPSETKGGQSIPNVYVEEMYPVNIVMPVGVIKVHYRCVKVESPAHVLCITVDLGVIQSTDWRLLPDGKTLAVSSGNFHS